MFNTIEQFEKIEVKTLEYLNSQSVDVGSDHRTNADTIEKLLRNNFINILENNCKEYRNDFSKKAMQDFAFKDVNDFYYSVDVSTHINEKGFHMPNLVSARVLSDFYNKNNKNYFISLLIGYTVKNDKAIFNDIHFIPIEFLSWECLQIGALGWGQIQISDINKIIIDKNIIRKDWMIKLCDIMSKEFYPKEIEKMLKKRIKKFETAKQFWSSK